MYMVIKTQTNKIFFLILIIISFFAKNSFAEIKAEPLNLKLQCKFIDGFILMNDKVSQRKIRAKDFFINLEVIKLNKRVISKITNNDR